MKQIIFDSFKREDIANREFQLATPQSSSSLKVATVFTTQSTAEQPSGGFKCAICAELGVTKTNHKLSNCSYMKKLKAEHNSGQNVSNVAVKLNSNEKSPKSISKPEGLPVGLTRPCKYCGQWHFNDACPNKPSPVSQISKVFTTLAKSTSGKEIAEIIQQAAKNSSIDFKSDAKKATTLSTTVSKVIVSNGEDYNQLVSAFIGEFQVQIAEY